MHTVGAGIMTPWVKHCLEYGHPVAQVPVSASPLPIQFPAKMPGKPEGNVRSAWSVPCLETHIFPKILASNQPSLSGHLGREPMARRSVSFSPPLPLCSSNNSKKKKKMEKVKM